MFYIITKHIHSGLRWLILATLILLILESARGILTKKTYASGDRILYSITMGFLHLQVLVGLILYFISPKVIFSIKSFSYPVQRFFLVEHLLGMIIAVTIFTFGYYKVKNSTADKRKFILQLIYTIVAFLIIMATIPWPFSNYGAHWI